MKHRLTSAMKDALMCITEFHELSNLKDTETGTVYFVSKNFRDNTGISETAHQFPLGTDIPADLITAGTINALRRRRLVVSKSDKATVLHTVTLTKRGQEVCESLWEAR